MRFTTQWRAAFRVKSFKAVVIRGKLSGEGGGGRGQWGRLEIRDRWWRSHVAQMLISWGGGWGVGGVFVRVDLLSGVVPRDRKSGEYVNLGMGHSFV